MEYADWISFDYTLYKYILLASLISIVVWLWSILLFNKTIKIRWFIIFIVSVITLWLYTNRRNHSEWMWHVIWLVLSTNNISTIETLGSSGFQQRLKVFAPSRNDNNKSMSWIQYEIPWIQQAIKKYREFVRTIQKEQTNALRPIKPKHAEKEDQFTIINNNYIKDENYVYFWQPGQSRHRLELKADKIKIIWNYVTDGEKLYYANKEIKIWNSNIDLYNIKEIWSKYYIADKNHVYSISQIWITKLDLDINHIQILSGQYEYINYDKTKKSTYYEYIKDEDKIYYMRDTYAVWIVSSISENIANIPIITSMSWEQYQKSDKKWKLNLLDAINDKTSSKEIFTNKTIISFLSNIIPIEKK